MKKDFSICSRLERENFWFSLEANPVGCQNNYLLVPEGVLRKLFSIEKKNFFSNAEIEQKKTWSLAQFFSAGLTKLDSTSLEEPFEKNFPKRKGFSFNMFGQRTKKFGLLYKISRKDVKTSFYVSTRTIWGSCGLKFCKIFNFFWPISKKFVLNKTGEGHRGELTETFVTSKNVLRMLFRLFWKCVDLKNKT